VGSNQRLEVWSRLSLHILANKDCTRLATTSLNLKGGSNNGQADLGLVDIRDGIRVGLLKLAHQLLGIASRSSWITPCVQVEPLLEDA